MIDSVLIGLATGLVSGWRRGGRHQRFAIAGALASLSLAGVTLVASDSGLLPHFLANPLATILAIPVQPDGATSRWFS